MGNGKLGLELQRRGKLLECQEHTRRPIERIGVVGGVLAAEPEREPGSIRGLRPAQVTQSAMRGGLKALLQFRGHSALPGTPGSEGVSGDVRTTVVKGQVRPASAEGRHAPIAVLQAEQPIEA